MKKLILVAIIVLALALGMAGVVSANGGPHGGYTPTTDACAGCHRAHTAIGPNLLLDSSTYNLCMSCHGSTGNGADSNVVDGIWLEGRNASDTTGDANTALNAPLNGGGFSFYQTITTTSSHDPTGVVTATWGMTGTNRGVQVALNGAATLSCASCHDPHGSTNYRIIPTTVNTYAVTVQQVDEGAKDYDDTAWGTGTSDLCAACHGSYHRTADNQGSTADAGTYTHRVDMSYQDAPYTTLTTTLPIATNAGNLVVCMTCHLPHGTSAQMSGFAAGSYDPPGTVGPIPSGDSALLRRDNRGVCQDCHTK